MQALKKKLRNALLWSQKFTKTDMLYLAKGNFWLFLERALITAASLGLTIVLANFFSRKEVGIYKFALSAASILGVFTLMGMDTALTQGVARNKEGSFFPALKTRLRWGVIGSGVCLIGGLYYYYKGNFTLTVGILIIAAFLPFYYSFNIYQALLQGRKKFDLNAKYRILVGVSSSAILMIGVIFFIKNAIWLIFLYFLTYTVFRFGAFYLVLKQYPPNQKADPQVISFGKHLSLMGVLGNVASQLDKILIWHFLGAGAVAVYYFALRPGLLIKNLLGDNASRLALPKLSQRKMEEIKSTLPKKIIRFSLPIISLVIVYIISAPFIFKILFPKYLGAIPYSQVFALSFLLVPASVLQTSFVAALKKKELYITRLGIPAVKIIMLLVLLPFYGIWGAIIALIASEMCGLGLSAILFKRAV